MLAAFPSPTITINLTDIKNGATPENIFGDFHGIYSMLPQYPSLFEASGHVDIFYTKNNSLQSKECAFGCYWNEAKIVYLWHLN